MENASKALIMAAEVLIGVMVISIGVALFTMFQNYSKDTVAKLNESKITEFNNTFLKYYGTTDDGTDTGKPIEVSVHDIISLANFAKQNNEDYELTFNSNVSLSDIEDTMYVKIDIDIQNGQGKGLETWDESKKNEFIKDNSLNFETDSYGNIISSNPKYYKLETYKISENTKRIYYVLFKEIK